MRAPIGILSAFLLLNLVTLPQKASAQGQHFDGVRLNQNKAVVTVLEAPLFRTPDPDTQVVQYLRKGEELYIHPAEFEKDPFQNIEVPDDEVIKEDTENYNRDYADPLFQKSSDVYRPDPDSLFYKTLSANGKDAYILKEHVFLLYNDSRELDQKVALHDPTDYRIPEPLPKGFPFIQSAGNRTSVSLGLGLPSDAPYSYPGKIEDSGFGFFKEINLIWAKNQGSRITKRFFFGGMLNASMYELEYKLSGANTGNRQAKERNFKLSAGPYASYDIWKAQSYLINLYGSLQFVFLDIIDVEQESTEDSSLSDARSFSSYHISPRAGVSFQKPRALYALDFIAGFNVSVELPHTFSAQDEAKVEAWWDGDEFSQKTYTQITYFLGFQSSF